MRLKGLGLCSLMVVSGGANAAGFALYESSVSALGTAFAGQAVMAQDASTIFANPAGLTEVQGRQFVLGGALIKSSVVYKSATGTYPVADGGNGGDSTLVPSMFYAMDLQPGVKFGLGIYAPFGLKTEYDDAWDGTSQGVLSDLKTVNLNPTLAWKVNDQLSLGLGVDYQYVDATLTNGVALNMGVPFTAVAVKMSGDDTAWGYNLGLTFQVDDATRIGLSYRSRIDYQLAGTIKVQAYFPSASLSQADIKADLSMPDMASLAIQHRVNDSWTVLADATWTGWSSFDKLEVTTGSTVLSSIPEDWKDSWRYALGATYQASDALLWRFGMAYDNTPIPSSDRRYARIPDADRITVALGARYAFSKQDMLDVGYSHIFFKDGKTTSQALPMAALDGEYKGHADILGLQWAHNF